MERGVFIWRQLSYWRGKKFWVAEGNTVGLRPGDKIRIKRKDGGEEDRIVRRVQKEDPEYGQCFMCPVGTPDVKRPLEEGASQ